ncbi:MAG: ABC transporter permease [Acidimicrobiales bacterium]
MLASVPDSRLRPGDVARVGSSGLRTRKLRTALSALGIAIGIAALVGVLGLSESSRADLESEIAALGTNLLTVQPGGGFGAGNQSFPAEAAPKAARIGPVEQVSSIVELDDAVLLNDLVNQTQTSGIAAVAADTDLLDALNGAVASGRWLDDVSSLYPNVVVGSVAAERLSITDVASGQQILIGDEWFTVIGILESFPLAPDLDRSVIVGVPIAVDLLDATDDPSRLFVRTDPDRLDAVRAVLPATADPENPEEVEVSRPSDVLEAKAAADNAFTALFLGLGAVALFVGGIGIANVMVIAVIERRHEIGLRRALGATKAHIRRQFLTEALVLAGLGGAAGVGLGAAVTAIYATTQGWQIVLPVIVAFGGLLASIAIGGIAGLYPAMRAANLAPTEALRAT